MPLDAVCLTAVVEELRRQIVGLRIEKVQQPARDQVILTLRGNQKLLLCAVTVYNGSLWNSFAKFVAKAAVTLNNGYRVACRAKHLCKVVCSSTAAENHNIPCLFLHKTEFF